MKLLHDIRGKVDVLLLLLVLPLLGLVFTGRPMVAGYIEFPPLTQYVKHAEFSWLVFAVMAVVIMGVISPFLIKCFTAQKHTPVGPLMPRLALLRQKGVLGFAGFRPGFASRRRAVAALCRAATQAPPEVATPRREAGRHKVTDQNKQRMKKDI